LGKGPSRCHCPCVGSRACVPSPSHSWWPRREVSGCEPDCVRPWPTKPCFELWAPISVVWLATILPGDAVWAWVTTSGRFANAPPQQSSSRWAGTITRMTNDQWQPELLNLANRRLGLRRAIRSIRRRLAAPVGGRQGPVHGYATRAERYAKQRRLQRLETELVEVEDRLRGGRVSVCRGGRRQARLRHNLDRIGVELAASEWRARWQAKRWFLTADGDATKRWGNETIRVHPDEQWLELRLPTRWPIYPTRPGARAPTVRRVR
jgi:hypothetical protein